MSFFPNDILKSIFNENDRRERELQRIAEEAKRAEMKRIEANAFMPDEFYRIKRDGTAEESDKDIPVKPVSIEIIEILGEYRGQDETAKEKMQRLEKIYYYMSDYGILQKNIEVLEQKRIGEFISQLGGQDVKDRIRNMYSNIDPNNPEEVAMMEAFFVNRIEKITEKIMAHYFTEDVSKNLDEMYVALLSSGIDMKEKDILAIDNEPGEEFKNWHKKWCKDNGKSVKTNTIDKFVSYVRLRSCKNTFYEIKNNAIEFLCENYKDNVKDYTSSDELARGTRAVRLLCIKLKDYGLPIALHMPQRCFRKDFEQYGITHATDMEMDERISGLPFKVSEEEQEKLNGIINRYLGKTSGRGTISRNPVIENEKNVQQNDVQTDNSEVKKVEIQEDKEQENEKAEIQEEENVEDNSIEEKTEKEKIAPAKRRGKEAFYRTNDETVEMVTDILTYNGVISQMPEEFKEKMLYVTASQKTKMEKIMLDMRKYLTENGVSNENLTVETAKMFAYSKILDRGFWMQVSGEREKYYEKAYKELQEHGDEFFDKLNSGKDLVELKKEMDALTKHRRGVRGARTIKQVVQEDVKEEIVEQDNKNEEISNEPINEVNQVEKEPEVVEENQSDIVIEVHREEPIEEIENTENIQNDEETIEEKEVAEEVEQTQQEEQEELDEIDPLQKEINGLNAEYDELKAKEEAIEQRKEQLQAKLDGIINSKEPLKKRRLKIKVALGNVGMNLLQKLEMKDMIEGLEKSLEQIEKEIAEQEQKEKEAREGIAHADEELNQMQEEKEQIKTKLEDLLKDL